MEIRVNMKHFEDFFECMQYANCHQSLRRRWEQFTTNLISNTFFKSLLNFLDIHNCEYRKRKKNSLKK